MPDVCVVGSMITSPDGQGVIIIGGKIESQGIYSNMLLELKSITGNWNILQQKLNKGRHNHLSFPMNSKTDQNLRRIQK